MNTLSLFDGMGCGRIALERAGIPVTNYYASEIDKYAIQIAQKNYPDIIQLGDITKWREWELPKIDLLIGGSPCQGFSFAGKQLNFDDPRSALFFEFVNILKHHKPRYFLLENVKMKKEYRDVISGMLGVEPIEINSALVSAQSRKRLYWTNIPGVEQPEDRGLLYEELIKGTIVHNLYGGFKEKKCRVFKGKSPSIRTSAGGGHIPSVYAGKLNPQEIPLATLRGLVRPLTPLECERLQTIPDNYTGGVSNSARYKMIGNGYTADVIAHILCGINSL